MPTYTNKDLNGPNPTRFSNWPREFPTEEDLQPAPTREELIAQSFRPVETPTYGPDSPYGPVDPNEAVAGAQDTLKHLYQQDAQNAGVPAPDIELMKQAVYAKNRLGPVGRAFDSDYAKGFAPTTIRPEDMLRAPGYTGGHEPSDVTALSSDENQAATAALSHDNPSALDTTAQRLGKLTKHYIATRPEVAEKAAYGAVFANPEIALPAEALLAARSANRLVRGQDETTFGKVADAAQMLGSGTAALRGLSGVVNGARDASRVASEGEARMAESATRAGEHSKARFNARQAAKEGFPASSVQEGLAGHEPVGGEYLHAKAPRSISSDITPDFASGFDEAAGATQGASTARRYPSVSMGAGDHFTGPVNKPSLQSLMDALLKDPEKAKEAFAGYGRGIGTKAPLPQPEGLAGENVTRVAMGRAPQSASPAGAGAGFSSGVPEGMRVGVGRAQQLRGLAEAANAPVDPIESAIEASGVHRPIQDTMAQKEAFDMGGFAGPQIKSALGSRTPEQAALYSKALKKFEGPSGDIAENLASKITDRPRVDTSYSSESGPYVESRAKNASGGGLQGSAEQTSRNAGMKAGGSKFVVIRKGGKVEDIIGNPEDFNPRPGEKYGKMVNGKFQLLQEGGK